MRKTLLFFQIAGFVFTGILGTLLHFLYDWTNSPITALFSAVNESIWEHMKLLFVPTLTFAFIQRKFFAGSFKNFWWAKLMGIVAGLLSIPILYYTYTGALGVSADWFNITIFFLAAAVCYITEAMFIKKEKSFCHSGVAVAVLCLIVVTFVVFTFYPPFIPLFKDPSTNLYGII